MSRFLFRLFFGFFFVEIYCALSFVPELSTDDVTLLNPLSWVAPVPDSFLLVITGMCVGGMMTILIVRWALKHYQRESVEQ